MQEREAAERAKTDPSYWVNWSQDWLDSKKAWKEMEEEGERRRKAFAATLPPEPDMRLWDAMDEARSPDFRSMPGYDQAYEILREGRIRSKLNDGTFEATGWRVRRPELPSPPGSPLLPPPAIPSAPQPAATNVPKVASPPPSSTAPTHSPSSSPYLHPTLGADTKPQSTPTSSCQPHSLPTSIAETAEGESHEQESAKRERRYLLKLFLGRSPVSSPSISASAPSPPPSQPTAAEPLRSEVNFTSLKRKRSDEETEEEEDNTYKEVKLRRPTSGATTPETIKQPIKVSSLPPSHVTAAESPHSKGTLRASITHD